MVVIWHRCNDSCDSLKVMLKPDVNILRPEQNGYFADDFLKGIFLI